uniref:Secreted protein n=1 Tax=Haemonchus placei TaxID=6290 RepID=A0A0N4W8D5_HAEPC
MKPRRGYFSRILLRISLAIYPCLSKSTTTLSSDFKRGRSATLKPWVRCWVQYLARTVPSSFIYALRNEVQLLTEGFVSSEGSLQHSLVETLLHR